MRNISSLSEKLEEVYHAPGMPGYELAMKEFEEIKNKING